MAKKKTPSRVAPAKSLPGAYKNKGRTEVHCKHYADHICPECLKLPEYQKKVETAPRTITDQMAVAVSLRKWPPFLVGTDALKELKKGEHTVVTYYDSENRQHGATGIIVSKTEPGKNTPGLLEFTAYGFGDTPTLKMRISARDRLLFDSVHNREIKIRRASSMELETVARMRVKTVLPEAMRYKAGTYLKITWTVEEAAKYDMYPGNFPALVVSSSEDGLTVDMQYPEGPLRRELAWRWKDRAFFNPFGARTEVTVVETKKEFEALKKSATPLEEGYDTGLPEPEEEPPAPPAPKPRPKTAPQTVIKKGSKGKVSGKKSDALVSTVRVYMQKGKKVNLVKKVKGKKT